jgi:hypothetical protein
LKKVIHVNQHKIRSNHKTGGREPVLTVKSHRKKKNGTYNKTYNDNTYCHEVYINGPCKVIYSPDDPLSCGARVWVETESDIECLVRKNNKGKEK